MTTDPEPTDEDDGGTIADDIAAGLASGEYVRGPFPGDDPD